jgi:hypothetical protein
VTSSESTCGEGYAYMCFIWVKGRTSALTTCVMYVAGLYVKNEGREETTDAVVSVRLGLKVARFNDDAG